MGHTLVISNCLAEIMDMKKYLSEEIVEELRQNTPVAASPAFDAFCRILDVLAAFAGLLIISPLLFFFALLVKTTSKGPVFFKPRIAHPTDPIMFVEILGNSHGIITMALHPKGKGFDALQKHPRIIRTDAGA